MGVSRRWVVAAAAAHRRAPLGRATASLLDRGRSRELGPASAGQANLFMPLGGADLARFALFYGISAGSGRPLARHGCEDEPVRGIFFDEDEARAAVAALVADGYSAELIRERLAGEDDDEDHPWAVVTDAPAIALELLVERYDGWLDADVPEPTRVDPPAAPPAGVPLPDAPRRTRSQGPAEPEQKAPGMLARIRAALRH